MNWETITRDANSSFGLQTVDVLEWDVYELIVAREQTKSAYVLKNGEPYAMFVFQQWVKADEKWTPGKPIPALAPMFQKKLDTWLPWKQQQYDEQSKYWRKRIVLDDATMDVGISNGEIEVGMAHEDKSRSVFLNLEETDALIQVLMQAKAQAIQWTEK